MLLSLSFDAFSQNIRIENDAKINSAVSTSSAVALAKYVVASGYACSSLSAVTPFAMSRGFYVTCNNWQYRYELADKGGRIIVTPK